MEGLSISLLPQIANPPTTTKNLKKFSNPKSQKPTREFFQPPNHKSQAPMGFEPCKPTYNNPQIANTVQNSHHLYLWIVQEFQNAAVELVAFLVRETRLVVLLLRHHIVELLRLRLRVHWWGWRRRRTVNPRKGLCGGCRQRRWWWSRGWKWQRMVVWKWPCRFIIVVPFWISTMRLT